MSERKSVLEPKPRFILASDELVPLLNWRSWRTWGVFVVLALGLGTATAIVMLLCWLTAVHLIDDWLLEAVAGALAAVSLCIGGGMILKRGIPQRDTAGRNVAGNPRLKIHHLPLAPLTLMIWSMSFPATFMVVFVLFRDLAGIDFKEFQFTFVSFTIPIAFLVSEIPYLILWRAPVQESDRDD